MDQGSLTGVRPGGDENLFETPERLLMAVSDFVCVSISDTVLPVNPKMTAY
jgi:hypothetical protein